jgi:hypothetical protein
MTIFLLLVALIITGVIYAKLHPFLVLPAMASVALFLRRGKTTPLFYVVATLGWLWQLYVVFAWCVFALLITRKCALQPTVVHRWIYYIIGFGGCLAPIIYMMSFDPPGDQIEDLKFTVIVSLTAAAFISFACFPSLATPWSWLVRFV